MKISIVMPAYNESGNIRSVVQELLAVISDFKEIDSAEIIVVDDHSSDGTYESVVGLSDDRVSCIRLSRRSGSHTALRAGLSLAKGDAALCISADGQDDPVCLREMINKWAGGVKVVWALRKDRRDEPWFIRRPAEAFYRILLWASDESGLKVDISRADFFFLDRLVVRAINSCPERNTSLFGLIVWLGFQQDAVEYERRQRASGGSKWSLRSKFRLAKDWLIAFAGLPIKIASTVGIVMSIVGGLGAIYIIIDKLFFSFIIVGWASIVVLTLILGGIQLIILGIIGEYLWRDLDESRKRPLFFIERMHGK